MPNLDQAEAIALLKATLTDTSSAYTTATARFLALDTTTGTQTTNGTEVSGYTRQAIAFTTPTFSSGNATCSNTAQITFTNMPAVTTTGVEVYTAATGTTRRLWFGALTTSKATAAGDTLSFAAGAIVATMN